MTLRTYVIRHVGFEDLGLWSPILTGSGGVVHYFQAGTDDLRACIDDAPELLIILGGPISVYSAKQYPFIEDELSVIRYRINHNLATIGICLGAQMIAAALGATVYPMRAREIGWGPIILNQTGNHSCLRHLANHSTPVLHWHGDTFDLPMGATRLASTETAINQAFSVGNNILAIQFHVEVNPDFIESWLIGHACELSQSGIPLALLRTASISVPQSYREASQAVLRSWLAQLQ